MFKNGLFGSKTVSSKSGVVDHNIGDILSNKDSDKGKAPVGWPSSH